MFISVLIVVMFNDIGFWIGWVGGMFGCVDNLILNVGYCGLVLVWLNSVIGKFDSKLLLI